MPVLGLFFVAIFGLSSFSVPAQAETAEVRLPTTPAIPIFFIEEPSESGMRFLVRSTGLHAQFTREGAIFSAAGSPIAVRFGGANRDVTVRGRTPLAGRAHFLLGRDPKDWLTDRNLFGEILYRELYPRIDLSYGAAEGRLKSEFVVWPGGDPARIRLEYSGKASVDEQGRLVVRTRSGELSEAAPSIYQNGLQGRIAIDGHFQIGADGSVGFEIGTHDQTLPLIIDPVISYATYLGGTGQGAVTGLAVDAAGSLYASGWTEAGDFPITGPVQAANQGGVDAFVVKLNPTGSAILYATYIGGRGDDRAAGIPVNNAGQAYVVGSTASSNFPLAAPARGNLSGQKAAFALKLNAVGNGLVYSTYLGGSVYEQGTAIAADTAGNAYVVGDTQSANFPVLGAAQAVSGGLMDAFITKLSPAGALLFSTYLGGSGNEHAGGVAVDSGGNVYITGGTYSANFPRVNPLQGTNGGNQDAFITKLAASGATFLYSTYLGGSGAFTAEQGNAIAVNAAGNAYVTGVTNSSNLPVSTNAVQKNYGGGQDAFIAELSLSGTSLVYCTYLGGTQFDWASGIGLDSSGSAYISGYTSSLDFPTAGRLQTFGGLYDAFVARVSAAGDSLTFSTFYGGAGADSANALVVDASGNMFLGGQSSSTNLPLAGPIQSNNNGGSQLNDQCQLNGVGSAASTSGSILSVTFSITFQPGFAGAKGVYLYASDVGANTGYVSRGSWTVTIPPPQPSADSVSPNSGMGAVGTFSFVFSDTQSSNNLTTMGMLIAGSVAFQNACFVVLDRNAGSLQLLWDNAAGSDSRPVGASTVLQNSQCVLGAVSVQATGLSQIVTVNFTFKGAFSGLKNIYLFGAEGSLNTGWVQRGTFTVAAGGLPMVGAVVPTSGTGPAQRFSFTFADQGGAAYINGMAILIASSLNTTNACSIVIDRTANVISVGYDNPANGATAVAVGSSGVATNSQCTLQAANSTVLAGTTSIVVTLDLSFNAGWFGAKNVYAYAGEVGANTGYVPVGSWTVTGGAPTADSVSPSSGTGTLTTFVFTVSDSAVQTNITGISMLFTAGSPSNLANACYMLYNRTNSNIGLFNDAGTVLSTKGIGSSTSLQNSQCAVGYTVMNTSGNSVLFSIQVFMKAAFSGPKTIYMQANEPGSSSGWVSRGTWIAP